MIKKTKQHLRLFLNLVLASCIFAGLGLSQQARAAAAPQPADSPCDPQYYDSLEARAWLEAQREITQNQNLIFKPDSVLEYTCFDRYLDVLATQAQNMFSETTRWGTILPSTSMDNALQNLVGTAITAYINANFGHTFLGGRSSSDYTPTSITGGSYSCNVMNQVWLEAKCMDFIDTPAEDGFFTFAEYQAQPDKRFLPSRCTGISGRWQTNINNALVEASTPWTEDSVQTFFDRIDPSECSNVSPIETGLVVSRGHAEPRYYFEKVCLPPGCFYQPSGSGNPTTPSSAGSCTAN